MWEGAEHVNEDELVPFQEVRVGVDEPADIRRFFEENSYLFFKGVLDKDLVLKTKADAVSELQRQGIVKPDTSEPLVRPGLTHTDIDDGPIYALTSWRDITTSPELQEAVDIAYGEPGHIARTVGFRHAMPTDTPFVTPPHQDHFYIQQTDRFRMIWIPLMDLEIANGGLAIAAGSEKHGLIDHVELPGTYSVGFKGRAQKGVPDAQIDGVWTSSPMEVGDFLMWHSCAVHKSLPNTSDRARLSLNTLTYPSRLPRIWQAERTIPELQVYRNDLRRLADAEGVDDDLFELIAIEAMKRGADPTRELVIELAEMLG